MKKRTWILYICVTTLLLFSYFTLPSVSYLEGPNTEQNIKELESSGIKLTPPHNPAKVSKVGAVINAWKSFRPRSFDKITIEYQYITRIGIDEKDTPAYIVSFKSEKGYQGFHSRPYGTDQEPPLSHEFNVFVNAVTGEPIMALQYR